MIKMGIDMDGEKVSYSTEYISYVENGESAAVFITRDIAKDVPTKGMWVDVISADKKDRRDGRWDFNSFIVELFPRKHSLYIHRVHLRKRKSTLLGRLLIRILMINAGEGITVQSIRYVLV